MFSYVYPLVCLPTRSIDVSVSLPIFFFTLVYLYLYDSLLACLVRLRLLHSLPPPPITCRPRFA